MSQYYDRNGNPATDLMSWAKSFEAADRTVGKTKVGDVEVSTVFLGFNHNFGGGPPLIFETMVFGTALDEGDDECERYSTEAEAIAGHERMVGLVRARLAP